MTSHDTLGLLVKAREKPWFPEWKKTLAVSGGSEGSLRNRLKTEALRGRVHAKTGFINDVYALSGYFEAENGRNYGFSMIFNGKSHGGKHPHHRMEEALTLLSRNPS
jgi:D-alanyl-D-alanine carboxypeptidase/D-alanyl-D-alanine-endopeptidase (penicillin-binding protein 4)